MTSVATPETAPRETGLEPSLDVRGVSVSFSGVSALVDVDLHVPRDGVLGLIGPNGSGKTTLVNCVSGVHAPRRRHRRLRRRDVTHWSRTRRARAGLARTYQSLRLFTADRGRERRGRAGRSADGRASASGPRCRRSSTRTASGSCRDLPLADPLVRAATPRRARPNARLGPEHAAARRTRGRPGGRGDAGLRDLLVATRARLGLSVLIIDHDVSFITEISDRVTVLDDGRCSSRDRRGGRPGPGRHRPPTSATPPADAARCLRSANLVTGYGKARAVGGVSPERSAGVGVRGHRSRTAPASRRPSCGPSSATFDPVAPATSR